MNSARDKEADASMNRKCVTAVSSYGDNCPGPSGKLSKRKVSRVRQGARNPCPDCCLVFTSEEYLTKHRNLKHCRPEMREAVETIQEEDGSEDLPNSEPPSMDFEDANDKKDPECPPKVVKDSEGVTEDSKDGVTGVLVCDICRDVFVDKEVLRGHITLHLEALSFQCKVCSKRFKWESDLRRHSVIHTDNKPYRCEECGRSFNQKSSLTKHMYIHTDYRPYECEICSLRFTHNCFLKAHLPVHSEGKASSGIVNPPVKRIKLESTIGHPGRLESDTFVEEDNYDSSEDVKPIIFDSNKALAASKEESSGYKHSGETSDNNDGNPSASIVFCEPLSCQDVGLSEDKALNYAQGGEVELSTRQKDVSTAPPSKEELPGPSGKAYKGKSGSKQRIKRGARNPCPDCCLVFTSEEYLTKHRNLKHCRPEMREAVETIQEEDGSEDLPNSEPPSMDFEDANDKKDPECPPKVVKDSEGVTEDSKDGVTGVLVCDICRDVFVDKEVLRGHITLHLEALSFQCKVCSKRFKWESDLRRHSVIHTDNKPYRCEECGRSFNQKSSLTKHMYIHTDYRPYECEICSLRFTHNCFLKAHLPVHSEVRPFTCKVCQKGFNRKNHLIVHSRIHSDIKPFQCDKCGKKFNTSTELKRHSMTHMETKPFQCPICNKSYNYRDTMRKHMLSHVGKQPVHECPVCKKTFTHSGSMNVHMRTHTGTKPHKCTKCEESFTRRDGLRKHMWVHGEIEHHKCGECGKDFKEKSYLKRHVKLVHNKTNASSEGE